MHIEALPNSRVLTAEESMLILIKMLMPIRLQEVLKLE